MAEHSCAEVCHLNQVTQFNLKQFDLQSSVGNNGAWI